MAADLATTPTTGLRVQACGDMHVANFGLYASAERNLVFAINDFDETHPGRWEWDLKRLAATGQRLIQGSPDIFLGWGVGKAGVHFYVRQLADSKGGVDFEEGDRDDLSTLPEYAALCGWSLALAHAKSGDAAMIAGYCGKSDELDEAVAKFSLAYARQTVQDHGALEKARRTGRVKVATEQVVK